MCVCVSLSKHTNRQTEDSEIETDTERQSGRHNELTTRARQTETGRDGQRQGETDRSRERQGSGAKVRQGWGLSWGGTKGGAKGESVEKELQFLRVMTMAET